MAQKIHFAINSKTVLAKTNSKKAKCFANVLGSTRQAKPYPEMRLWSIKTQHWDDEQIVDCNELDSILKLKETQPQEKTTSPTNKSNKVLSNLELLSVHF